MRPEFNLYALILVVLLFCSCREKTVRPLPDTPVSGTVTIGVDETFGPMIREEIDVFQNLYTAAHVIDIQCTGIEAFNLLLKDSVRMIIGSRTLTDEEADYFDSKKIFPKEVKIATDGIAFIVHKENPDTLITTGLIQNILVGKVRFWNEVHPGSTLGRIKVVFDNPQSSTAEYARWEICKNKELSPELRAMDNNAGVINYVSENQDALGIIGINRISNRKDTTCMGFLEKINVVAVSKEEIATVHNSYQPYQAYLATGQYPYTRDLYVILTDPRLGLTSGFTSFIASDRGQRIILKSGILPATQPLRIIQVNDNF